ncbi:MAG: hypothetical protein FVQ81_08255 [Candidatus Glassbacteria bacterium]|nr:hypothetical protein [Candidatus Glassbacteria bacterium]
MRPIACFLIMAAITAAGAAAETSSRMLGNRSVVLEEIYYEDFEGGLDDWLPEGSAAVSLNRGWLEVDGAGGEGGYTTIWCRTPFEGPQLVEYDVRLMSRSMESNVNMFLLAGNPDVEGLLATTASRDGSYGQYHEFPNYLITILNGTSPEKREQLRLRMRLDPGFELVEEGWFEPLTFGRVHHVAYLLEPPKVSVYLDNRLLGSAVYGKTYTRGLHGLRIWRTHSIYDNFRVSRIVEH